MTSSNCFGGVNLFIIWRTKSLTTRRRLDERGAEGRRIKGKALPHRKENLGVKSCYLWQEG